MFIIDLKTIQETLLFFGITDNVIKFKELLRYDYDKDSPEIRVIMLANFSNREPVVIKFIKEELHPQSVIEEQSAFSEQLRTYGITTPKRYFSDGRYCIPLLVSGTYVTVTVEDYAEGELKLVYEELVYKIGALLAQTHNVSFENNLHVNGTVLFNVLADNDLFSYDAFCRLTQNYIGTYLDIIRLIQTLYSERMEALCKLKTYEKYAVQGDISNNNLYLTSQGELGLFDYNNCGDNYLLSDAVMQGIFMARLMDYAKPITEEDSERLYISFMRGYSSVRPFTEDELTLIPHIYALTNAFWLSDLVYSDSSLKNLLKSGDVTSAEALIQNIYKKLNKAAPCF